MMSKSNRVLQNVGFGFIAKVLQLFLPFVVRTVVIYRLGIAYAGINSLFISFFNILNLTELGIGAALNYVMYKPVAESDIDSMNGIIALYNRWYRRIGLIICVLGLALIPFLPHIKPKDFPDDLSITAVYIIYFISMVLPYFIRPYSSTVLSVHLREDVISKISSVTMIGQSVLQIVSVAVFNDYYLFSLCSLLASLVNAVLLYLYYRKLYPVYRCEGSLPAGLMQTIRRDVRALFMHKIGGTVLFSADNIVISMILGQVALGVYGNYYVIITALGGFCDMVYNSARALIGNRLVLDTPDTNYEVFDRLCFWDITVLGIITAVLVCTFQQFIVIWVGEKNSLQLHTMLLLACLFYVMRMDYVSQVYRNALGLWEADKWRPIISSFCNLLINIVLTLRIGIDGVILSSIVCILVFHFFNTSRIVHRFYFKKSSKRYYVIHLQHDVQNLLAIAISASFCFHFIHTPGLPGFFICGFISLAISCVVLFTTNMNHPYVKEIGGLITSSIKKRGLGS